MSTTTTILAGVVIRLVMQHWADRIRRETMPYEEPMRELIAHVDRQAAIERIQSRSSRPTYTVVVK